MLTTTIFPGRYVQGPGVMKTVGGELERFGRRGFFIVDPFVLDHVLPHYRRALEERLEIQVERFGGECSDEEIERVLERIQGDRMQFVAGVGGGKTMDTAKVVADRAGAATIIVPTLASTDAPCSALSVIYTPRGRGRSLRALPEESGIGFESGGLAAAHAIHNGLTEAEPTHEYYHGEKVAIGVAASLFLTPASRRSGSTRSSPSAGRSAPTTLADIGLEDPSDELLRRIAGRATRKDETIHNEPVAITVDRVIDALRAADREGGKRKRAVTASGG